METIQTFLFNAFAFVIVLSLIVSIHEYGHYIVARWCGVRVEMFSIGFGKELFGRNDKHGTRWKVCLIPMGGYVKMFGDSDPASSPDHEAAMAFTEDEKKEAFHFKPLWAKAAIVSAGPIANFLLTFVVLTAMFSIYGKTTALPVVAQTVKDSPAEAAGLQPGDNIIAIDGNTIETFGDIQRNIALNTGTEVQLKVLRENVEIDILLTPEIKERKDVFGEKTRTALIGIQADNSSFKTESVPFLNAIPMAVTETGRFITSTLKAVGQMITGARDLSDISGPIGIAKYSGHSISQGMLTIMWFVAVLSANLGLVNLFPIPALDGGHLVFYTFEALRGKPMAEKYQEYAVKFGVVLILVFAVFAVYNDLQKIFG